MKAKSTLSISVPIFNKKLHINYLPTWVYIYLIIIFKRVLPTCLEITIFKDILRNGPRDMEPNWSQTQSSTQKRKITQITCFALRMFYTFWRMSHLVMIHTIRGKACVKRMININVTKVKIPSCYLCNGLR